MSTWIRRLPEVLVRQGQPAGRPWWARAGASFRSALEASSQARARVHLRDFADQCEATQPELAKELRVAGDRLLAR
jgi:hypothetical protein